ncbi:MAG: dephospho-CoA kinase [Thermodesulforhabdaceae bacterium]|jgi:dephospho-CoA kinase
MAIYPRIALTGGIASGKSTVARMLQGKGAFIIDADVVARKVVEPGTPCWHELRSFLEHRFFDASGRLDRRALREAIVRDPDIKRRLESIVHPAIVSEMNALWEKSISEAPDRIVIFDIPLLFEVNLQHRFDFVIVVYVPRSIQQERLALREKISIEEAQKLIKLQKDIELKKAQASIVITNDGSLEETARQVDLLWEKLTHLWQNFAKSAGAPRS